MMAQFEMDYVLVVDLMRNLGRYDPKQQERANQRASTLAAKARRR